MRKLETGTLPPVRSRSVLCLRPADRRQAQAAFDSRFGRLDPGQPPEAWLGIGFKVRWVHRLVAAETMRTLLGLGEVRIERRLSLQQDLSEAKQPVGDATQRAAMRFAAPAQRGIALAAFGVVLRGDARAQA